MEILMFTEKVFTIEEISEHLRVPEDAVLQEVTAGRLRTLRIAGHVRVRESDFNAYLTASCEAPDATEIASAAPANEARKQNLFELSPAPPFDHTWPANKGAVKTTEQFVEARQGIVSDAGRERHVKIGFTLRSSAGKRRRRCLILVDRYPTVEFVAADEKPKGKMASIIRGRNGKQLPIGATLPPEYKDLPVGSYNEVVRGPRASNGVAVVCDSRDFATMVKHALVRYRFREGRAATRRGPV
jgi:excisionase family DNA binding protein